MSNWFVYDIAPIDSHWRMLPTVEETIKKIEAPCEEDYEWDSINSEHFMEHWELAKQWAKEKGWEGDFREDARVFWVPDDTQLSYGFVWKQDNNGTTYVVSPVALPHLQY